MTILQIYQCYLLIVLLYFFLVKKAPWKTLVYRQVFNLWSESISLDVRGKKSLQYLNLSTYTPGKPHPLLRFEARSPYDANRTLQKLKVMLGAYILQSQRANFNQNAVDPTCKLCSSDPETLEHFVLACDSLSAVRETVMYDIEEEINRLSDTKWAERKPYDKLKIILDCTHIVSPDSTTSRTDYKKLENLEYMCKKLIFRLHSERYKNLINN